MSKFDLLHENHTNGANYDLDTNAIIARLEAWDAEHGIEISDVGHDRLLVRFLSFPDDIEPLAKDIYQFCPDVIDQHFGCMDEMLEMMDEMGQEPSPDIAELVDGVDFNDENFGLQLLQKSLMTTHSVALWWD